MAFEVDLLHGIEIFDEIRDEAGVLHGDYLIEIMGASLINRVEIRGGRLAVFLQGAGRASVSARCR